METVEYSRVPTSELQAGNTIVVEIILTSKVMFAKKPVLKVLQCI